MKTINICFAINDWYSSYLGIAIFSLLYNLDKNFFANIYILESGISPENKQNILNNTQIFINKKIEFIFIDTEIYSNLAFKRVPFEKYFIFETVNLFPQIDKIIYLDADIIVNSDISKIADQDIWNHSMGAVKELTTRFEFLEKSKIWLNSKYFNSWVLIMNLNKLRKINYYNKFFDYVKLYKDDQDAINWMLSNDIYEIPPKFNALPLIFYSINWYYLWYKKKEFQEAKTSPIIIHYAWEKPWNKYCFHPLKELYNKYKNMTTYETKINQEFSYKKLFKHYLNIISILIISNIPLKIYKIFFYSLKKFFNKN